jgi:hypothetical protein
MMEIESPLNQLLGFHWLHPCDKSKESRCYGCIGKRLLRRIWQPKASCEGSDRQPAGPATRGILKECEVQGLRSHSLRNFANIASFVTYL